MVMKANFFILAAWIVLIQLTALGFAGENATGAASRTEGTSATETQKDAQVAATPTLAEKKMGWDQADDATFLSDIIASYEAIAFTARPLTQNSDSVSMQVMANDRVRSMARVSKRVTRLLEDKEWKIDASAKKRADEKIAAQVVANAAMESEMALLDALTAFHAELAKYCLEVLEKTDDPEVAVMARYILDDQIESIMTAKRMPELIAADVEMQQFRRRDMRNIPDALLPEGK